MRMTMMMVVMMIIEKGRDSREQQSIEMSPSFSRSANNEDKNNKYLS